MTGRKTNVSSWRRLTSGFRQTAAYFRKVVVHNIHNVGRGRAVPSNGTGTTRSKQFPFTGMGVPA